MDLRIEDVREKDRLEARLENDFTYHPPFGDQTQRYNALRAHAQELARHFVRVCPAGRELSLALTNLEQAVFWGNASIARNEKPE